MNETPPQPLSTSSTHEAPALPEPEKSTPSASSILFLVAGVTLAFVSQLLRAQNYQDAVNGISFIIFAVAALFTFAGLQEHALTRIRLISTAVQWVSKALGMAPMRLAALGWSLTCALLAAAAADSGPTLKNPLLAVGCWLAAIALALISVWQPGHHKRQIPWQALAWAGGLTALAFFFRAVATGQVPTALTGDEASFGLGGVTFLKGAWNNIFFLNWYSFPALYFLIPAGSISLLGQTTAALRLPSALGGALTVGAIYLVGRTFYNHRSGLWAALLLAGLHFHIHFSRLGINNIWDGLFFSLVALAFWRAWQSSSRFWFVLTGFFGGLALYFYVTAKLIPLLLATWWLILWFIDRQRCKRNTAGLLLMFAMLAIVYAPLGWLFLRNPQEFIAPFSRVSSLQGGAFGPVDWASRLLMGFLQIFDGFRGFTDLPTRSWYLSGVPVLRPIYAAFFLLGFIPLLLRRGDGRTWILITWVAAIALAGGLSESTPAAQRYVAGAPVAALIAGFCLAEIGRRVEQAWPHRRRLVLAGSALIVLLAVVSDLNFYFLDYTPRSRKLDINTKTAQHLADYLRQKEGDWQIIFYGEPLMGYRSIASIPYLAPRFTAQDAVKPWGDPQNPIPTGPNTLFIFIREHEQDLAGAQAAYPRGRLIPQYDSDLGTVAWIYEVSQQP